MTDERWQEIIGHIKDHFTLTNQRTEDLSEDMGPGTVEIIEFDGPLGKMRLERTTKPLITGRKSIGSRRIGSQATVEYQYSDTEQTHKFNVYKYDPTADAWEEMKAERGEMFF